MIALRRSWFDVAGSALHDVVMTNQQPHDVTDDGRADRAAGVLLGQACGDALGVPYEFATPPGPGQHAEMLGGGLGDFAPGEWSDDTAMAVAVAEGVVAGGGDRARTLDAIASGFLRWFDDGPADIGNQTAAVLAATRRFVGPDEPGAGAVMTQEAAAHAARHPHSAGNGALMRTGVVALAHLDDRDALAGLTRDVALLTHADPLAVESCVLWCEAIRVAVVDARLDVSAGLDLIEGDRREQWRGWLDEAIAAVDGPVPGSRFTPNGFTVTALQAAVAAIVGTPVAGPVEALHAAVRIGNDTDTIAAIAGTLLGARWGASTFPAHWTAEVHGWPGRRAGDLVELSRRIVAGDHRRTD